MRCSLWRSPWARRFKWPKCRPGPPVLQTLVAEVYGPDHERRLEVAREVRRVFDETPGVVDVDWYVEEEQPKWQLEVDSEKAAAAGLPPASVAAVVRMAGAGEAVGLLHDEHGAGAGSDCASARPPKPGLAGCGARRAARRARAGGHRGADALDARARGAQRVSQESAAGHLCDWRHRRGGREPGVLDSADEPRARIADAARRIRDSRFSTRPSRSIRPGTR